MLNENSPRPVNRIAGYSEPSPIEIARRCSEIRGHRIDEAHDDADALRKYRARLRFIQFLTETSR